MTITLTPEIGEDEEFTPVTKTVTLSGDGLTRLRITSVSYEHENGVIFADMRITFPRLTVCADSDHFTYSTEYAYAVDRWSHYTLHPSETVLTTHAVRNPSELPEDYWTLYWMENPQEFTRVTFTITVMEQTGSETGGDDSSGASTISWGREREAVYTWVDNVYTNYDIHRRMLVDAVNGGSKAREIGTIVPMP